MPVLTELQKRELRRLLLAGERTSAIAARFGLCSSTVSYYRTKLGLPPTFCPRKFNHDAIHELHAQGLSDHDIAERLGISRPYIGRLRRRMGLKTLGHTSVSFVTKQRAHGLRRKAELFMATGIRSLYSLDGERHRIKARALAARYGLPTDLLRVQTAIVVALAVGPQSAEGLAERLGRPAGPTGYHRFNSSSTQRCGARNYLTSLIRRGLVERISRQPLPPLYMLTAQAVELLASRQIGGAA
jgi:DNA-binding CsgD family transcriptional regulator